MQQHEFAVIYKAEVIGLLICDQALNVREGHELACGGLIHDQIRQRDIGINRVNVKISQSKMNIKKDNLLGGYPEGHPFSYFKEAGCIYTPPAIS